MAGDSYVDDPYFGYAITLLEHYAIATSPLDMSHMAARFYSDRWDGGSPDINSLPETPPPDAPGATETIDSIYYAIKGEQPGVADDMADQWEMLGEMLFRTGWQLRDQTVMMADEWEATEGKEIFLGKVGETLAYLKVWSDAAYTNSTALRGLAEVMREAWKDVHALWLRWQHAKAVSPDRIDLAGQKEGSNTDMEEDRKDGAYGDDSRSLEENQAWYSHEARVLASEIATKYAPFLAQLETGRAVLLKPLNARMHPGATGLPWDPPTLPPGGLPPGGLPPGGIGDKPPGSPGEPPPKDAPNAPPTDKLDKPPGEDLPPKSDLPPTSLTNELPPNSGLPPLPPVLPPGTPPPTNLAPPGFPPPASPPGLGPLAGPTLGPGVPGALNTKPPALPGDPADDAPPANNLANGGLFPPGTITPPPGGMPQQPNNAIGQRKTPGVPGSGMGAPPPGSTPQSQQAAKQNTQAGPRAQETPEAFQIPPSATPPVLGARNTARSQRNRYSTPPTPGRVPNGATPPVLANPRLAGAAPKRPTLPPWLRKTAAAQSKSELAADVPTGTAPVLDGRLAPTRQDPGELAAGVPAGLLGRAPSAAPAPDRKSRRETQADRKARVPQKAAEHTTETKPTTANAWEVNTPGGPVVAGGGPQETRQTKP